MNILETYFKESDVITNKQAKELGVKRHTLAALAKKGFLERVKNGVYKLKNAIVDEFATISLNCRKVVFSFHTALYLHSFSDRTPGIFHITVPQGYNIKHIKRKLLNIKVHYVKKEHFNLGIVDIKTPFGSTVKCYDMERCVCDIVSKRKFIDRQIFTIAIVEYFNSKNKNIRTLVKYSKVFGIEDEIRKYIEVL